MERKIMEKMDAAWELLRQKVDRYNKDLQNFVDEIFGDDIYEMILDLCGFSDDILLGIKDSPILVKLTKTGQIYVRKGRYDDYDRLDTFSLQKIKYTDSDLSYIKRIAESVNENTITLNELKNHTPYLMNKIVKEYEEKNNRRNKELDDIMKLLEADTEPVKRIKITVEFI